MPLEDRDAAYLWDMLQVAREVEEMMEDQDLAGFLNNLMLQRAIERSVENIGEAERRLSTETRQRPPEIPWRQIIGQRNILTHEYGQIDRELLYNTAANDIPALIRSLEKALPPIDDQ